MGSLGGLMKLMPGMSKDMREAAGAIDDGEVSRVEAIVCSMTPAERSDVSLMDGSRRSRVARGSGTTVPEVNTLLKQFKEMQKMMKGMASGNMPDIPGMPSMGGMSGRAARKLTKQAAGPGGRAPGGGAPGGGVPVARPGHALAAHGRPGGAAGGAPAPCPGRFPRRVPTVPVISANKGTKKKKKGGRVTPPKRR